MPAGSSTGDYHSEPFDLTGGAVKVHIVPACTGGFTGNIMKIWFVPQDGAANPNQPEDVYINPNPEDAAYELYATPGSGDSKANAGEEPGPYQSGSYLLRVYTDTPSTITVSEQR
jgi:hypothetical protein